MQSIGTSSVGERLYLTLLALELTSTNPPFFSAHTQDGCSRDNGPAPVGKAIQCQIVSNFLPCSLAPVQHCGQCDILSLVLATEWLASNICIKTDRQVPSDSRGANAMYSHNILSMANVNGLNFVANRCLCSRGGNTCRRAGQSQLCP